MKFKLEFTFDISDSSLLIDANDGRSEEYTSLEDVPEDTRLWKPETAPQATVTKRIGNIVPSFALLNPVYTGRFIEGCATTRPTAAPTIMQMNMKVVM